MEAGLDRLRMAPAIELQILLNGVVRPGDRVAESVGYRGEAGAGAKAVAR
ncbi:MAG: hypothetical protein GY946_33300 [bacterium]|nr:hypothetical protein [bacterium]